MYLVDIIKQNLLAGDEFIQISTTSSSQKKKKKQKQKINYIGDQVGTWV